VKSLLLAALTILCMAPAACAAEPSAAELHLESGAPQTPLVELFSDEAYAGCPEAERWVSSLVTGADDWKRAVPVVMHVSLREKVWKDRLARPEFLQRLAAYGKRWRAGAPRVPTMAVNGVEWSGWAKGRELPAGSAQAGVLIAEKTGPDEYTITITPAAGAGSWTAHAAILGMGIETKVYRGDNAGKALTHDFTALAAGEAPLPYAPPKYGQKEKERTYRGTLRLSLSAEPPTKRFALAVWVSAAGDVVPVQSVGGPLPSRPKVVSR
jgi:hypothetical protein